MRAVIREVRRRGEHKLSPAIAKVVRRLDRFDRTRDLLAIWGHDRRAIERRPAAVGVRPRPRGRRLRVPRATRAGPDDAEPHLVGRVAGGGSR